MTRALAGGPVDFPLDKARSRCWRIRCPHELDLKPRLTAFSKLLAMPGFIKGEEAKRKKLRNLFWSPYHVLDVILSAAKVVTI